MLGFLIVTMTVIKCLSCDNNNNQSLYFSVINLTISFHCLTDFLIHIWTRQSEMADLARRATRWVGTFPYILTPIPNLYDHSFPRYGQITFLTFRRPTTMTFDLKFWKYLSVTVYPYVICMPSFIMIGWSHTNKQTHKQTHKQTDMGITIPRPPPMGAR